MERNKLLIMRNQKACLPARQGFTLIEILVVIFIVGLLSAVVFANYRQGEKKYALSAEVQKVISQIRKAQNMAMSGAGVSSPRYYGYGVHFDESSPNSYIFFGDKNNNQKYDSGELISNLSLGRTTRIKNLTSSPLDVYFASPNPTTYLNANSSPGTTAKVVLEIEGSSNTKSIYLNTSGLIRSD